MNKLTVCLVAAGAFALASGAVALDLIRDGKPAVTIVVPVNANDSEQGAAERLVKYLKLSSGAELTVIREGDRPLTGTAISVGRTQMAKEAGISDEGLKNDGYRLVVKEGTLYLLGRDTDLLVGQLGSKAQVKAGAQGTLRAAFGLLDRLGFRWLQPTPMGTYVPDLKTVSVPDALNVTYEPPLMYMAGRMYNWGDWSLANSYRTAVKNFTMGGHTWGPSIPSSLYETHPEYFVMVGGKRVLNPQNPQFCSSSPGARQRVTDWTMSVLKQGYEMIQLGQADGFVPCECELCAKLSPGDQVHNANLEIIRKVTEQCPDCKVQALIYGPTMTPTQFESYPSNTVGELCGSAEKDIAYWSKATPAGVTVYSYYMGCYWDDGFSPRFYPELAAAKMKHWLNNNVKGVYWCGGGEKWGGEGPTYYVLGRLATDPAQDWHAIYEEYLNLTFRKAAPAMKQYYDALYKRLARFRDPEDDMMLVGLGKDGKLLHYKHGSSYEMWVSVYTEQTLVELKGYLDKARQQAGDDAKAQGWIRLARISYEQYALIARMFHEAQKHRIGPAPASKDEMHKRAAAYYAWVDKIVKLNETEPEFKKNFFPDDCAVEGAIWSNAELLKNNSKRMPPVWFE